MTTEDLAANDSQAQPETAKVRVDMKTGITSGGQVIVAQDVTADFSMQVHTSATTNADGVGLEGRFDSLGQWSRHPGNTGRVNLYQ